MRAAFLLAVAALAIAGCALRPRYADFISKETPAPVKLQLIEKKTGAPIPNAAVEVGELRGRVNVKTDADGYFVLPIDKQLLADNALIVVSTPPGFGRTQVVVAPEAPVSLPVPAPMQSVPAPVIENVDRMDGGILPSGRGDSNP